MSIAVSDEQKPGGARAPLPDLDLDKPPRFRPRERFWPYADLPEQPTEEELAALDPDLRVALYGPEQRPFSVTIVFPPFDGDDYEQAVALARQSAEYREVRRGSSLVHRARYHPEDAARLSELWAIVGRLDACEVLIDDRPIPFARELWLPLIWFLLK